MESSRIQHGRPAEAPRGGILREADWPGTLAEREAAALQNLPDSVEKLQYDESEGYVSLGLRFKDRDDLAGWLAALGPQDRNRYEMLLTSEAGKRFYVRGTEMFEQNPSRPDEWHKHSDLKTEFDVPIYMSALPFGTGSDKITEVQVGLTTLRQPGDSKLANYQPAGADPMEIAENQLTQPPAAAEPVKPRLPPSIEKWVADGMPSYEYKPPKGFLARVRHLGRGGYKAYAERSYRRRQAGKRGLAVLAIAAAGLAFYLTEDGISPDKLPPAITKPAKPKPVAPKPKPPQSLSPKTKPKSAAARNKTPASVRLKTGGNPWVLSERILRIRGLEYPSVLRIMRFDKRMARLNPDVYHYSGDSSRFIPVGTELKIPRGT